MHDIAGIIWLFVLLLGNAFFVAAEFAVISVKRAQLEPKAAEGSALAKRALWCLDHVNLMLATTQLGITICSLLILNVSEPAIHHLLSYPLSGIGLSDAVTEVAAFIITLLLVSFLHVVFGEMVPKNISFSQPGRSAMLLSTPLLGISRVFRPIVFSLNWLASHVVRLVGITPRDSANSAFTLEQVATIVDESTEEGTLEDVTGTLRGAFEFTERTAGDISVPLSELQLLPVNASAADVEAAVAKFGYSRYPVATVDGSAPTGYIHLKDVLDVDVAKLSQPLPAGSIRPLLQIKAEAEAEDALELMQRSGTHLAAITDAQGASQGVLFLEDIIEVLVGEVHDATTRD